MLVVGLAMGDALADPGAFDDGEEVRGPVAPSLGAPIPAEVLAAAVDTARRPLPERMGAVSAALLRRPYVSDPMGEGQPPDADPLARYDAFDCLTFAEEVLALSLAGDPLHAADVRSALRYGQGPRDYAHRRHFMELQWIPGVVADGWMVDTTASYGEVVTLDKEVTADTWKGWSSRAKFALADSELPTGRMHLDVLPLDEAVRVAAEIRPGSLILTVRTDRPGVPLWVTHVGLLVPDAAGKPVLRHATKIGGGGTRDHGLPWYLEHVRGYPRWPVLGIAVLEPVDALPRVSAEPLPHGVTEGGEVGVDGVP